MSNIYWKDIPKTTTIIDNGHSFMTENGSLIYWHGQEAYEAQSRLTHRSTIIKKQIKIEVSMNAQKVLQECIVEGNVVKLPEGQLERKLYQEVAKALDLIGGKWKGGKIFGFVFQEDPTKLLTQIASGEKRNLKKEYQFFATPSELADYLVKLAEIKSHHIIGEPQAGQGAIVEAILRVIPSTKVFMCELMPLNAKILQDKGFGNVHEGDYLKMDGLRFDRIISNPPFTKNQDIDHIKKMYSDLLPQGRLVSVSSKHWQHSSNNKETEFRNWLKDINAEIIDVEAGTFKESGTSIDTVIIVINK